MSLSEDQMLDVMAFADGELAADESARVAELVASNDEAKELLSSLHAIGDGVRGAFHVGSIDVRDAVMARVKPNDLDKVRIKRTARTRMTVVGASLVALAAAVLLYVRTHHPQGPTTAAAPASGQAVLASAGGRGVEVDFVDTPTPVSVFYVPSDSASAASKGEPPPSVVVWVDDSTPEKTPEKTPDKTPEKTP